MCLRMHRAFEGGFPKDYRDQRDYQHTTVDAVLPLRRHWLITVSRHFDKVDKGEDHSGMLNALLKYLRYCASVGVYSEFHS